MKPEPLKDKIHSDMECECPVTTLEHFNTIDIKSAVEWLKNKIVSDGVFTIEVEGKDKSGLVDVKKVFDNINEAFEDVMNE